MLKDVNEQQYLKDGMCLVYGELVRKLCVRKYSIFPETLKKH